MKWKCAGKNLHSYALCITKIYVQIYPGLFYQWIVVNECFEFQRHFVTYFEYLRSTSGPVWWWKPLWVLPDVAAQQGRGTGFCVLAKIVLAPLLVEAAAFFTSCKNPWFALPRPFRQCIVMRRAECLIIQNKFIFSPPADLERHCYLEVLQALKAGGRSTDW